MNGHGLFHPSLMGSITLSVILSFASFAADSPPPSPTIQHPASAGRKALLDKLNKIRLDELRFPGIPLSEVAKFLRDESVKRDPEKKGLNFLINPNGTNSAMSEIVIRVDPALRDVSFKNALDVIQMVADHPIRVSIEDYAVVFSEKDASEATVANRFYRADPNTFSEGLKGVAARPFGVQSTGSGGGAGNSGTGSSGYAISYVDVTGGAASSSGSARPQSTAPSKPSQPNSH